MWGVEGGGEGGGGGREILCVCSGSLKNQCGMAIEPRAWLMSRAGSLCRDPGTWDKGNKINFAIIWQPSQPGKLESRVEILHVIIMLAIASPVHVTKPLLWFLFGICRFRGSCMREYDLI